MSIEDVVKQAESLGDLGPTGRLMRFKVVLPAILATYPGGLVEIGAGTGESTREFLLQAKAAGRRVLVIDYWPSQEELGGGYGGYQFTKFQENTADLTEYLDICYVSSFNPKAMEKLWESRPIAFCFVDGLQTKDAVVHDLNMTAACQPSVICVDDWDRLTAISQVPLALAEFLPHPNYRSFPRTLQTQEGYLLRV